MGMGLFGLFSIYNENARIRQKPQLLMN